MLQVKNYKTKIISPSPPPNSKTKYTFLKYVYPPNNESL